MGRLLLNRLCERTLQALAGTGERGHDGANRDAGDGGDLLVRTALELAQYDHFTETHWECFESAGEPLAIVARDGQCFWRRGRLLVQVFVEFSHELHLAIFLQPRITRISDDLQKPGSRITSVEAAKKAKSSQQSFLRDVFRIRAAP